MAAPYQVKLCNELQNYFNTEFWFHVYLESSRPDWWKIDLSEKCKILSSVLFKKSRRYLALSIFKELRRFNPDIILLGGFTLPTNILAYFWAKKNKKKVFLFTEIYRGRYKGINVQSSKKKGLYTTLVHLLFAKTDGLLTSNSNATRQMIDEFGFKNVQTAQYPTDIDEHLKHDFRHSKKNYTFLFANRLTQNYNPLFAIEIFADVLKIYPDSNMLMNNNGDLRNECVKKIKNLGLSERIKFLGNINSWNELHLVYKKSDILLFPAKFSNGNLSIIEAMASGMGIIISDKILGINDFLKNEYNCFICDLKKENYLIAIKKYIENPQLFTQHGKINKIVASKYSIESTAELYNKIILEILQLKK